MGRNVINLSDIFLEDLKDDFELAGKGEKEFSIYDFIGGDLSKAFAIGFCINNWKLWIPITVRKELRHANDNLEVYKPQLKWLSDKCDPKIKVEDYVNFVMTNIFCDNSQDLINLALVLGGNFWRKANE